MRCAKASTNLREDWAIVQKVLRAWSIATNVHRDLGINGATPRPNRQARESNMRAIFSKLMTASMVVSAALVVSACGKSETTNTENTTVTEMNTTDTSMDGTTNDMTAADAAAGADMNATAPADANAAAPADANAANAM